MAGGLKIAQARERNPAPLGAGFRRVKGQTVERCRLDLLYISQHFIGSGEIACMDGVLRLRFKNGHLWIITGLDSGCGPQLLEALGDLDKLCRKSLGRDVFLAKDVECRTDLALIEIQLLLEVRNQLSLRGR